MCGRDQVVGVEQRGDDQEVEVGAVARQQHQRVALGVVGHLLDPRHLDRREQPADDRRDEEVQDREEGRAHVRRDLDEHRLGVGARDLDRHAALGGAALDRLLDPGIRQHDLLDLAARLQRRSLDHLLLAIEEHQDRAPDHAGDRVLALGPAVRDEGAQVDRLAHLDREVPVGREERRHLGEVGRPRLRAVEEVQEAAPAAGPLAPEDRERHQVDRLLGIPDPAHHLLEQVELALALRDHLLARGEQRGSAARCAGTGRRTARRARARARSRDRARAPPSRAARAQMRRSSSSGR